MQNKEPVPVREFLTQDKLKRADIVLCRGKKSLYSRLIRWATKSNFSHAAIVFVTPSRDKGFDNTFLLESVTGGVDITDIQHYAIDEWRGYDLAIKRFEAPWFATGPEAEDIRRLVRGCMLNFVKADYDYLNVWRLAVGVVRRFVFGVRVRVGGLEPTLRRAYAKGQLAPGSFICSGFVQYGFYDAVRRLADANRLTDSELAEVVFKPTASARPDTATLLSTTPEDLAQAEQLSWKYVIIDQHVYEVTSKTEAYALIARKGIRHQAPG